MHEVIPSRNGRRHVLHVLDRIGLVATAQDASKSARGKVTDLAELLAFAQPVIKRRSVVFVISDFISTPGWGRRLAQLARRHEVIAVRVYDPMEVELPDLGLVVMQDAETGEQLTVDTHDRAFRQRFAAAAARREAALRDALAEARVDCLELATDEPLDAALLRFTQLRKRRSQLAAGGVPAIVARTACGLMHGIDCADVSLAAHAVAAADPASWRCVLYDVDAPRRRAVIGHYASLETVGVEARRLARAAGSRRCCGCSHWPRCCWRSHARKRP